MTTRNTGRVADARQADLKPPAESASEPIRGRFKLTPVESGGAMLGWTTDLCDRCLNCGCGTKRPHLDLTPQGSMKTFLRLRQWQKNGLGND